MKLTIASLALAASMLPFAGAQTVTVDHLTQSQLIEKAQELNGEGARFWRSGDQQAERVSNLFHDDRASQQEWRSGDP
jgi:hypothetical protein